MKKMTSVIFENNVVRENNENNEKKKTKTTNIINHRTEICN